MTLIVFIAPPQSTDFLLSESPTEFPQRRLHNYGLTVYFLKTE
jgi:hypothetical protein